MEGAYEGGRYQHVHDDQVYTLNEYIHVHAIVMMFFPLCMQYLVVDFLAHGPNFGRF